MPAWKVAVVALFGLLCLALGWGTLIVAISFSVEEHKWLWFSGLLFATLLMTTLFVLFMKVADRSYTDKQGGRFS